MTETQEMTQEEATQATLRILVKVVGRLCWGKHDLSIDMEEARSLLKHIESLRSNTKTNQRELRGVRISERSY